MSNPEFDPSDLELADLHQKIDTMATAQYLGDLSVFRAGVNLKLRAHGLPTNQAWMYFMMHDDTDGGCLSYATGINVLVMHKTIPRQINGRRQHRPFIRIMASERIISDIVPESGETQFLTTDVTVNHLDNTQYCVGASTMYPDGMLVIGATPFYYIRDENLKFESQFSHTPIASVTVKKNGEGHAVMPFGAPDGLSDKEHALKVAIGLFEMVKDKTPDYNTAARG